MIFLDTNILIEILKDNQTTIDKINTLDDDFTNCFKIIDIDQNISKIATNLIYKYSKSHNLNIPDGIIAATAIKYDSLLFTYNLKNFKYDFIL